MSLRIIPSIFNSVWAIDKGYADSYLPLVINLIQGKNIALTSRDKTEESYYNEKGQKVTTAIRFATFNKGVYNISEYGMASAPEEAPADSIAILNITDVITKYNQDCGPAGMLTKADLLRRMDANPNINAIVLNIDSGGGEGYASMMMAETIQSLNTPVFGFVNDLAASAAFEILAATKYAAANSKIAQIGSVGTYVTILDYREMLKMEGIDKKEIYADASSEKNKAYYDAINGDDTLMKEMVNKFNDQFIADIEKNRGDKMKDKAKWATGRLMMADEALKEGLIDEITTFEQFIQDIQNGIISN